MRREPPGSTDFPYTPLFRSRVPHAAAALRQHGLGAALSQPDRRADVFKSLRPGRTAGRLRRGAAGARRKRSEEHTSELQSQFHLVSRPLLENKKNSPTATRA